MSKYDTSRPCVYGRGTATGGCTCPGYKGRRKGVCACGHERGWHKQVAATAPTGVERIQLHLGDACEKLTWEQVVTVMREVVSECIALKDRVAKLEVRASQHLPSDDVHTHVARLVAGPQIKPEARRVSRLLAEPQAEEEQDDDTNGDGLPRGERRVLTAIAQSGSGTGASRSFISQMTGYKARSITNYVTRLRSKGYVSQGWPVFASPSGFTALGPSYAPLPTGHALLTYWMQRLGSGEQRLLEVYTMAYPQAVSHEQVRSATGYAQRSITNYATRLLSRRLITKVGHGRRASDLLFDKPRPEAS
jgi:hypothetical protein